MTRAASLGLFTFASAAWFVSFTSLFAQEKSDKGESKPLRVPAAEMHQPRRLPDRIVLTFCGDPATAAAVTWRTDTSVTTPVAQIALATENSKFAAKAEIHLAKSEDLMTDFGEARYHSVVFDDLMPATKYAYRVGDGSNWSEWFQFTTASKERQPFTFIYFGDAQNNLKEHWSRVIRESYSDAPKARFLLHAGDLVNNGGSDAEWGEWFGAGAWLNATVPNVPIAGNHEYSGGKPAQPARGDFGSFFGLTTKDKKPASRLTPHWRAQFTLPDCGMPGLEESVYSFDFQGTRFICLNSNERIEEQVFWLEDRLRDNPNTWTVVSFHHPIYSTAKGRDNKKLRESWQPIFDRYRVDLVLQGHDHSYGRSGLTVGENLSTGTTAREPTAGTIYVVSVSGPKMYSVDQQPWMRSAAEHKQLYQIITIDGARLRYEAHTATGALYDLFELRKRPGQQNQLLEREDLQAANAEVPQSQGYVGAVVIIAMVLALFALNALRIRLRGKMETPS